MAKDYDKEDGVWRTIGGRKVFIRKGQNLADAMIESGKFKGQKNKSGMRESYRKEKEKDLQEAKDLAKKFQESETDKDYYAFLNKVEDNGEKYDKTLEEREKEKQRNDEIDKQRGTKPLREKERENKARKELEEARERQDEEDYKNRKDAFDYSREEVTKAYETMRNKMQTHMDNNDEHWSAKEYTNAEFLAHLENANWHGEMKQLEEANLTPQQLTEIKNKTTLSSWGVGSELTGKENVQKMIDEVKSKKIDEHLNRDKSNDKLNYNENTKEDTLYSGIPNRNKSTNETQNNFKNNWQDEIKTYYDLVQKEKEVKQYYDNYKKEVAEHKDKWNDTTIKKNEESYKKTLQEIDDWKKEFTDEENKEYEKAYASTFKNTNETMNNAIREKASNKILSDSQLRKMKWEDVIQANTEYFNEKSIYDFEGGRQGKYKYEDGWRDNGGAGVIKQSDLDRLIDKEDWERANKGYGKKYDSVDEAIKDKDSAINQYIRNKADEKKALNNAWNKYKEEHPNTEMTKSQFKKDIYKK